MTRNIVIFPLLCFFLLSCNFKKEDCSEELKNINSALLQHYREIDREFLISALVTPNRFSTNHDLYYNFKQKLNQIDYIIDSLLENRNYDLKNNVLINFNELKLMLDSIYIPRLDTVRSGRIDKKTNTTVAEIRTQKSNLEKFLAPLESKIKKCSSESDLHFAKLYISLIDREVITFLYTKALEGTMPINFIKPLTIKKDNKILCYVASVDTCNYPIIYIGKFESFLINDYINFRAIEIVDTIYFNKEKAEIKIEYLRKYDAVLEYQYPNGSRMRYMLK